MEKKKQTIVSKLVMALLLFAASSGGLAWGQVWNDTSGPYVNHWCDGTYTIQTWSWTADNNFGPGETGVITPLANGNSTNSGVHTAQPTNQSATRAPFAAGDGVITVGGTPNIVMNVHSHPQIVEQCSHSATWSTSTSRPSVVTNWGNWDTSKPFNGTVSVSSIVTLNAGGAPNVPDGTGQVTTNGAPSAYTYETKITVNSNPASQIKSEVPWNLEMFNFLENKWHYNNYSLQKTPGNTCSYMQRIKWSKWVQHTTGSPPHSYWSLDDQGWLTAQCSHKGVFYTHTPGTGANSLPARIVLTAGSHVRLTGHGGKSIGHGGLGSTTAYLNLPNSHYTLMNDEDVTFGSIVYNSNGGNAVDPILGANAVFGVKKQLDKDIKTNPLGGTILIGQTPSASQGFMTITASTTNSNTNPYGFSGDGGRTVYTGTCIPKPGTANLGNYGANDVTVDGAMHLPTAMSSGKLQIYNTKSSLYFYNKLPATGGAGNVLLMAAHKMVMYPNSIETITLAAGNTTVMGGHVWIQSKQDVTLGGGGNYDIIAYTTDANGITGKAPGVSPFTWTGICGSGAYDWCNLAEPITTAWPNITSPLKAGKGGQDYDGDCMPVFLSNNGSLQVDEDAKVTVNSSGSARWQAFGGISTGTGKKFNWTVAAGGATAQWLAGGNITLGTGNTVDWSNQATGGDRIFWNAGGNINTNDVTANWTTTDGNMYWRARNTIQAGNTSNLLNTIAWTSSGTGDMSWEATNINVMNGTNPLTFDQTGSTGRTSWNAMQNIDVNLGDGGVTFTNASTGGGSMIWLAGRDIITKPGGKTLTFVQTTPNAGLNAWKTGRDIRTNNKILFENQDPANTSNMEWHACHDILTNYGASTWDAAGDYAVTFTNKSEGDMIWHAGNDIKTGSKTEFTNEGDEGHITWYAGHDIITNYGADPTNKLPGEGILFTQKKKGQTVWWAKNDIITNNTVHFDWTQTTEDESPIEWRADQNIYVGGKAVAGDGNSFSLTDPERARAMFKTAVNNQIRFKTDQGMIQTNSQVDIERDNTGAAKTLLIAGCQDYTLNNNIDIENVFNYTETAGQVGGIVKWYAENDILSNTVCDNDRPAPITFTVPATSTTTTLWEAERNINTKGRVDFKYGGVTAMGPLTWLSRGGYIQTERPVTVAYESDNTISLRAEDGRHDLIAAGAAANADAGGRRGNIHFFDSIDINRNNQNGGLTEIKAENHIWTAMLNYVDQQSTGDSMEIISHKGDIYLGYNDGTTSGFDWKHYVANSDNWKITQQSPSATCAFPAANPVSYDLNRFTYTIPASNQTGHLWIKAGWEEETDYTQVADDGSRSAGGNIYFTHLNVNQPIGSIHPTEITIPFSGLWRCGEPGDSSFRNRAGDAMQYYENAGIIAGVSRCVVPYPSSANTLANDTSLIYRGGIGNLKVDAGTRGNIIINKGAYLNFQDSANMTGDATFRTRFGDIDMRDPFNVDSMRGGLLFLAQIDNLGDLSRVGFCGCAEERNNVYLQDFQYQGIKNSGSVFVGADNNIKLNYGGLQNKGTRYDPFLSTDYKVCPDGKIAKVGSGYLSGGGCGNKYHCDMDTSENQARDLILNFEKDATGNAIGSGGFAAVASDYIDVYKNLIYTGGSGSGMSTVPGTGTLHGESVAGYGLYMKTQANKDNWDTNIFFNTPKCPTDCSGFNCNGGFLHMISRLTFHADARIYAHNQKVYLGSPVIESFGPLVLNSDTLSGGNTQIVLQSDSLIMHDSLVLKGTKTILRSWSGLKNDRPVMKFGYMRRTPPFTEYKYDDCNAQVECAPCYYYIRGSKDPLHMLDTITIKFEKNASLERLNSTVFDHTVLTFQTDSFDHKLGNPILDAKIFVDTLKVRNQVDLYANKDHTLDAHFELISEEQMFSKDYAGVYTKHYHMEPIGPCGRNYSELWLSDDLALDVITTSTFGGFGVQHSDVHVENMANLNPGFTSLRLRGQCYEQKCGTLTMKDLRLDGGSQLHFSVGTTKGINGEYSDIIDVDKLTTYGTVDVNIEIRPCEKMLNRCYPIIYYKSQTEKSLNNLNLVTSSVKIDGEDVPLVLDISTPGIVYVCVGNAVPPALNHSITIPSVAGVTTDPPAGIVYRPSGLNFEFKAAYTTDKPMVVRTNRVLNGVPEVLTGVKNANGEYEYVIRNVRQHIVLSIGPDFVANTSIDGRAVWSHGEMIYIRVEREDIASIYSVAGQLVKRIELPEGDNSIPMQRGVYVVTLKDGSIHKVIVK